jgi:hypothetical protein
MKSQLNSNIRFAEPDSYDTAKSFEDHGRNHNSTPHIKVSTSSGPSTVSSYSGDTGSEQSVRSPISSEYSPIILFMMRLLLIHSTKVVLRLARVNVLQ